MGVWLNVRPRTAVAGALVLAGAVMLLAANGTLASGALPVTGRTALDVIATMVTVLVAAVLVGRNIQTRLHRDVLLIAALLLMCSGNFLFAVLPELRDPAAQLLSGAPVVTGILSAALFTAACWSVSGRSAGRSPAVVASAVAVGLVAVGLFVAAEVGSRFHSDPGAVVSTDAFGTTSDPLLSVLQGLAALLFLLAAWGAVHRSERDGDQFMSWVALSAVMAAVSRTSFAIAASLHSPWATAGTFFRVGFYALLLAAAGHEVRSYWRRATDFAVLEERRRIARELHDGLAQELAFIASQSRLVVQRPPSTERARLVAASAERALDESRRAIAALTRPLDEPLEVVLAQEVEEVAHRLGARVSMQLEEGVHMAPDAREALLRIAREAVSNAGRHARAQTISVNLANHDGVTLQVADDGVGFDVATAAAQSGKFGLTSMRERAEALGGRFALVSRPEGGTSVEVWLP